MRSSVNSCNSDLDLHAIWQECSDIPTSPPCLGNDLTDTRHILSNEGEHARYETQRSSLIEFFSNPDHDNLSAFEWAGPDPLSMCTQASDIFLYVSALVFF